MRETELLGTLLPSSPDFLPILRDLRVKYGLPEIDPEDDPIEEVFLDREPRSLHDFRRYTTRGWFYGQDPSEPR